jgi:hypothetical protein
MRRLWGTVALGRLTGALIAVVLLSCAPAASAAGTNCKLGRSLLDCSEKVGLYYDSVNWAIGGFGSLELFEATRPLHLNNPALAQFWRFEAASGITRYEFELGIGSQSGDQDFEEVQPAANPTPPVVKSHGIVTRKMARAMSVLMQAEQREIVNLVAMDVALNRATYALQDSRTDWANYQTYVAAGFARSAAAAISAEIPAQRALTKVLVHNRLMFGVGPADQRAAQKYVRKHGFPHRIQQIMVALGMNDITIGLVKYGFLHTKLGPITYSMSRYLSSSDVIAKERQCRAALRHFAGRIPAVARPA